MNWKLVNLVTLAIILNCEWSSGHASYSSNPLEFSPLELLQRTKRSNSGSGGGSSSSNPNPGQVSSTLQQLTIGQQPSIIPSTSSSAKKTKLTSAERQAIRAQEALRVKELTTGPVSRFEGKHLYENGVHKGKVDSFDALTSDSSFAKQYLVELNRKLYKGGVLPQDGNNLKKWTDRMDKTSVTIVDGDIDVLTKDLQPKFEAWKQAELAKNGKLPERYPDFTTDAQYKVTHLTFEPIKDADGNILEVSVKAEQYKTKVELGTDANGKPSHFEKMNPVDISQPANKIRETNQVTKFTVPELQDNAKLTKQFWKDVGVPANLNNVILNEQTQAFKNFVGQNDVDLQSKVIQPPSGSGSGGASKSGCIGGGAAGRRRRAAIGGACAIIFKPNGEVDSVHPKEFVDEYIKADKKGKEQLADLAKDNVDKMVDLDNNQNNQKKMKKLIQLEDMKTHVASVDVVTKVQSQKKGKTSQTFANAVDSLQTKLSGVKTKVKLSASKISAKFSKLSNSKVAKGFAKGVGAVSDPLGKYFLAKTVVNGIINGDTTSLAIVGARVGYEVVTETAVWAGTKFFSAASKVGKSAKFLGQIAGPIGAVADIGLSVWSLTKSVGRLNAAKNQYEKNDAIADIVSDSVDIVVTAAVTVLSIALAPFPPAVGFVIAVGAVIDLVNKLVTATFKAANEVGRINSEIPLLESEKSFVFTSRLFDWFGTRQKDYLEYLLEEKAANDMAVQHNLKFLQDNPTYLGIVFPSRTLAYDGGCNLTKQHCALKNAWGCTRWEDIETVGSNCDWNRPCSDQWGICTDHWERVGDWGYDDFKCVCDTDKNSTTTYGFTRKNSFVDFRQQQTVYWERAGPVDVEEANFKCKPGSGSFVDYKLHQNSSRLDYLCENAIALLQPSSKRNVGQTMLFDLDDGYDRIYLPESDSTPNLFRVGNEGRKEFFGGSGRNEFLFDGNCTLSLKGTLSGGASETDVLTILGNCMKGEELKVNFKDGLFSSQDGNLSISFQNIEDINGRENEGDNVVAACQLRKVALKGGNVEHRDLITVPDNQCSYNLTIMTGSFTNLESEASRGDLSILVENEWKAININMSVHPKDSFTLKVFFLSSSSHQVTVNGFSVQVVEGDDNDDEENEIKNGPKTRTSSLPIQKPDMVLDVTISLPGLSLLLNDSDVLAIDETKISSGNDKNDDSVIKMMESLQVQDWKILLNEAEENILADMPDIPRSFNCDDCQQREVLKRTPNISIPLQCCTPMQFLQFSCGFTKPYPVIPYLAHAYPIQPYPIHPYPTHPYPAHQHPIHTYPIKPFPIQPYPIKPFPIHPYPIKPYSIHPYPIQPYPIHPYPIQPYPIHPYPIHPYPVQPYPIHPYPVQPYPIHPYLVPPAHLARSYPDYKVCICC
ncbi:unnamed protein product [Orchesella dallaii]|uniref:Uncharacterized protein n=1 Tax=Orchesella dallaii TaxID=48710 RepID=A0ABP1QAV9_9HEXA